MAKKPKLPKTVRTVKALCAIIRAEFHMSCDRMKINGWQTRHSPPFPAADENNAFNVKECLGWVRKLQARKGQKSDNENQSAENKPMESQLEILERRAEASRLNSKIIDEEEKQFEFDCKKGKFVDREIANRTFMTAICEYHAVVKRNIQGLCDEELAKKIIGGIEADCTRLANENV